MLTVGIKRSIIEEGAKLAARRHVAANLYEQCAGTIVDLEIDILDRKKKTAKSYKCPQRTLEQRIVDAKEKKLQLGDEYQRIRIAVDAFQKTNNVSVISCWEAKTKKVWPFYKVKQDTIPRAVNYIVLGG